MIVYKLILSIFLLLTLSDIVCGRDGILSPDARIYKKTTNGYSVIGWFHSSHYMGVEILKQSAKRYWFVRLKGTERAYIVEEKDLVFLED